MRSGLQQRIVFLETPDDGGEDLLQWLGPRFTLGRILGTILDDLATRNTVLHVHIGTPCRQLDGVKAVDETVVSSSQQN